MGMGGFRMMLTTYIVVPLVLALVLVLLAAMRTCRALRLKTAGTSTKSRSLAEANAASSRGPLKATLLRADYCPAIWTAEGPTCNRMNLCDRRLAH